MDAKMATLFIEKDCLPLLHCYQERLYMAPKIGFYFEVLNNMFINIFSCPILHERICYPIFSSPELKAYRCSLQTVQSLSLVHPSSASSSTMLKHLLLGILLANQSHILCGASMGRENESLFLVSG